MTLSQWYCSSLWRPEVSSVSLDRCWKTVLTLNFLKYLTSLPHCTAVPLTQRASQEKWVAFVIIHKYTIDRTSRRHNCRSDEWPWLESTLVQRKQCTWAEKHDYVHSLALFGQPFKHFDVAICSINIAINKINFKMVTNLRRWQKQRRRR